MIEVDAKGKFFGLLRRLTFFGYQLKAAHFLKFDLWVKGRGRLLQRSEISWNDNHQRDDSHICPLDEKGHTESQGVDPSRHTFFSGADDEANKPLVHWLVRLLPDDPVPSAVRQHRSTHTKEAAVSVRQAKSGASCGVKVPIR